MKILFLPPANEVFEGYVFTRVCHSVHRRGCYPIMHCRWYPSMPCSRSGGGGIPTCLAAGLGVVVSQHALQASRPTSRGELRGSGRGGLQTTPEGEVEGIWPGGSPGPHPRGVCLLQGGLLPGVCVWRTHPP